MFCKPPKITIIVKQLLKFLRSALISTISVYSVCVNKVTSHQLTWWWTGAPASNGLLSEDSQR